MLKKIIFLVICFSLFNFERQKNCKDFKYGTYSIFFEDSEESFFTIDRDKSSQVEINPDGEKVYYNINWINECSYIQKFDSKKNKLTPQMRMINQDGGLVIELLDRIDNKCINYQSYVKKFKKMSLQKGKFCKE